VTPLSIDELPLFDPLADAVVFGTREVQVEANRPLTLPMLGSRYTIERGENMVPEALAVFLCCRGLAELAGGRKHAT
jgi:DNA primase small subunit